MTALVSAELLKLRTTRALRVGASLILALAVLLVAFVGTLAGKDGQPELVPDTLGVLLTAPARLAGGVVFLICLLATAGEFRYRTIITTHLAEPRAAKVLAAKLLACGSVGLVLGVALELAAGAAGAVALHQHQVPVVISGKIIVAAAAVGAVLALHALLGVGLGALVRNTTAAVTIALLWVFVLEGVAPVVLRRPEMTELLPVGAIDAVLAAGTPITAGSPSPLAGLLLLVGYAGLLSALASLLDRRREI
jgi:hypothetical protein